MSDSDKLKQLADAVVSASAEVAARARDIPELEQGVRAANDRLNNGRARHKQAEEALEKARADFDAELDR